jgi:hypothetical protein
MDNPASKLDENISRRDFTVKSALALLSGVTISIVGCSSDSTTSPSPIPTTTTPTTPTTPTTQADVSGIVSANHGHTATITGAQLTASNALSLDITGNANHLHTVELSADEVSQIAGGMRVSKTSSTNSAHNHEVVFN